MPPGHARERKEAKGGGGEIERRKSERKKDRVGVERQREDKRGR